jgi:mRNA interferase RelE/StbE
MPYKILIEKRAEKDLRALGQSDYSRILERLLMLRENPRLNDVKKLIGSRNSWRLRVGDYRILYDIVDSKKEIKVYRIKHRREAYKL